MRTPEIVWDTPTRILHWLVAVPVLMNYFIEGGDNPHKILGYIAAAAVILRLIWGLKSNGHSSLRSFPLGWKQIKSHSSSLLQNNNSHYIGHNPLASWCYLLIWLLVILLGISGFMMGMDAFWGVDWVEEGHEILANLLLALVLLHFVGLIMDSIKYKRKTWLGMITGKK